MLDRLEHHPLVDRLLVLCAGHAPAQVETSNGAEERGEDDDGAVDHKMAGLARGGGFSGRKLKEARCDE